MRLSRLAPWLLALFCAGAASVVTVIIEYNNAGTLITRTDLALVQPPAAVALVPITTMRAGKIYSTNVYPRKRIGSSTANETNQPDGGSYTPGRWPGESLGQVGRNGGAMRIFCARSHFAYDDPIVYPGEAGKTHLHVFFGNTLTAGTSTPTSIRTTGNSTCQGGTENRSAYWMPAMIYVCDTAAKITAGCNAARNGEVIDPMDTDGSGASTGLNVYYKGYFGIGLGTDTSCPLGDACNAQASWWVFNNDIVPLPVGFRMIAGKPTGTPSAPMTDGFVPKFACRLADNSETRTQWLPGTGGTTACAAGFTRIIQEVPFMTCWNGIDLDSPSHNSHIEFPLDLGGGNLYCRGGFTTVLPGVEFKLHYRADTTQLRADVAFWRLSSDNYDTSLPAGYSSHGDWFNGWDSTIMASWVADCIVRGVDCHDGILGPSSPVTSPRSWRYMTPPRYDR